MRRSKRRNKPGHKPNNISESLLSCGPSSAAQAEAQQNAHTVKHLATEVEELRRNDAEQLKRIEAAKASYHTQEEAHNKVAAEVRRRKEEETAQLQELQNARNAATAAAESRLAKEPKFNRHIPMLLDRIEKHGL